MMMMTRCQMMSSASPALLLVSVLALGWLASLGHAYPAFYMQAIPRRTQPQQQPSMLHHGAQKRAFDRLDVSPFDFDAMTKRFSDDELSTLPFDEVYVPSLEVRKRAFDRLEDSGFFGLKKRAFDRLDNSFMLMKRAAR